MLYKSWRYRKRESKGQACELARYEFTFTTSTYDLFNWQLA